MRLRTILLTAALGFAPMTALAQNSTQPANSNAPATPPPASGDTVGPRELQNFSLPGTTTTPAPQPAERAAASPPNPETPIAQARQTRQASRLPAPAPSHQIAAPPTTVTTQPQAAPAVATSPAAAPSPQPALMPPASSVSSSVPETTTVAVEPERHVPLWPWIAAALALGGGAAFLWLRRRPRQAYAGLPNVQEFAAPEPVRAPPPPRVSARPAEVPRPAPKPVSTGIVSSRLRPQLEVGVRPIRCVLGEAEIAIEFEVELLNAGSSPARSIFAEASLFNAGVGQEQELEAFFAKKNSVGNRLDRIEPLKNVLLTSRVVAPRSSIEEYELAGRKSFVPLIAINALYEWGGGNGQTGAAFLIGRDSGGEKLGPLWLDTSSREISALGARPIPVGQKS